MGTRINAGPRYTLSGELCPPNKRRFVIMVDVQGDKTVTARKVERAINKGGLFGCKGLNRIKTVTHEYKPE